MSKKNKIVKKIKKTIKPPYSSKELDEMAKDYPLLPTQEEEIEATKAINAFRSYYSSYQQHPEMNIDPNGWIQTYTGKKFYIQNPIFDSIDILDIAHALSQICRYTGHCQKFHSVAHHSVLVSYFCKSENALAGLLHDASEAFLSDLSSVAKRLPELAGYKKLEKKVQSAIYRKFGLSEIEPPDVKQADLLVLSIETNSFMMPTHPDWKMTIIPTLKIDPLSPSDAKELFLRRFQELYHNIPMTDDI